RTTGELEVVAEGNPSAEPLKEKLLLEQPEYLTYVTTDRHAYQPGDPVYFRSVTLDRSSRHIPERTFAAIYEFSGVKGVPRISLQGVIGQNGIGGGDFVLPASSPDGEYTLTCTDKDGRLPAASCRLLVRRASPVVTSAKPNKPNSTRPGNNS